MAASLQRLCQLAQVDNVRLLMLSGNGPCACTGKEWPGDGSAQVFLSMACCQRLDSDAGAPVVAIGAPESPAYLSACACGPLPSGGTLALQLGLVELPSAPRAVSPEVVVALVPVLMWAREGMERQAVSQRLAELEKRRHSDLGLAMRAHEEEREWLAYEVHDRIAQTLASVFQQLQALEALAHSSPEIRQLAVRSSMLTREAIREARTIMNDLHPPVLDELGLVPLVEEELRRLSEDMKCRTRSKLTPRLRLPRDMEIALYRILHEALVNIRRHSQANEVVVSLEATPQGVDFEVRDNGVGFDVATTLARRRVGGLMSLQRRAELAGGTCDIGSIPGRGTTVRVWVPGIAITEGG
ncbi:MAG: sensor histidine kinase [Chloroflexi bacterium]|nr:sensor histidine kinase [Chloroflexota bacterium]